MADQEFIRRILTDPQAFLQFVTVIKGIQQEALNTIDEATLLLASHRHNIPLPIPMHDNEFNGEMWVNALLKSNPKRIHNALRMDKNSFLRLCEMMEVRYGLKRTQHVSIQVDIALFLYILAHKASNRDVCERFSLGPETVSHHFKRVLGLMWAFGHDYVKPNSQEWATIHPKLAGDPRYDPYFKDAIGVLDGTHIKVVIPGPLQLEYCGRSGIPTMNVLGVCDFNMLFTFVLTGCEGSMHDARVLHEARSDLDMCFPEPPPGKYYLGDKGYANRNGVMAPYFDNPAHPTQFRGAPPTTEKEYFNRSHSSLRSVIERCYGALKKKWKILANVPPYDVNDQSRIISACFALHNYVMLNKPALDTSASVEGGGGEESSAADDDEDEEHLPDDDPDELADPLSMTNMRNQIADAINANVRR